MLHIIKNVCIIISFFVIFIAVAQCDEGKNEIVVENNEQTGVRAHQTFFNFPNLVICYLKYFVLTSDNVCNPLMSHFRSIDDKGALLRYHPRVRLYIGKMSVRTER